MSLLLTPLRELVVGGNETSGKFICESVRIFGADTSVWERIRKNPEFADKVVEESLRQPRRGRVHQPRRVSSRSR